MRNALYILLICPFFGALGQTTANVNVSITMPSVALIDILPTGSTNITLTMTAPTEAGNALGTGSSNSANWLILSSAVTASGSRSIKGEVVGTLPTGVSLKLEISPNAGGEGLSGIYGVVTGNTSLTNTSTTFISNIKGAYSGNVSGTNGYKLKYSLEIQNYSSVKSGTSSVTVRYTMVDN